MLAGIEMEFGMMCTASSEEKVVDGKTVREVKDDIKIRRFSVLPKDDKA